MEHILSGYCRVQDQSRTVFLEQEDGEWDCSCDWPDCIYAGNCPIGKQMTQIQKEESE